MPGGAAKLAEIIAKALEKDRRLRSQSAAGIRADLARLKRDTESTRHAITVTQPAAPAPSSAQMTPATPIAQPTPSTPYPAASGSSGTVTPPVATPTPAPRRGIPVWIAVVALVVVAAIGAGAYFYLHRAPVLTSKDSIVLADFTNTTGDSVFDGTLRQGLVAQLAQSPFLNIVPDQQVSRTLRLMGQPAGTHLSDALAKQVCERPIQCGLERGELRQSARSKDRAPPRLPCSYQAESAVREAVAGDAARARQQAATALKLSNGHDTEAAAALALALAGDAAQAQKLADDLEERYPEDMSCRTN